MNAVPVVIFSVAQQGDFWTGTRPSGTDALGAVSWAALLERVQVVLWRVEGCEWRGSLVGVACGVVLGCVCW